MNEKLKEAFEVWRKGTTVAESIERSKIYPYLALPVLEAAAKGEFPGFQLVPVEPTDQMMEASGWDGRSEYAAMLTAYKDEQT